MAESIAFPFGSRPPSHPCPSCPAHGEDMILMGCNCSVYHPERCGCEKPGDNMPENIPGFVTLHVVGQPAPQGSKRAFRNQHTGRIQQVESSKAVTPWRADVRQAVEQQAADVRFDGPVHVALTFRFTRPKGHYRTGRNAHLLRDAAPAYPAGRKDDVDKLARSTLDALVSAGLLEDDGQVVDLHARKVYAEGEPSGADITVRGMGDA